MISHMAKCGDKYTIASSVFVIVVANFDLTLDVCIRSLIVRRMQGTEGMSSPVLD